MNNIDSLEYLIPLRGRLTNLTKELKDNQLYWLHADEGGMIGTPRYLIAKKRIKKQYFGHFCKATPSIIRKFIENSIIAWAVTNTGDFSKTFTIEIKK